MLPPCIKPAYATVYLCNMCISGHCIFLIQWQECDQWGEDWDSWKYSWNRHCSPICNIWGTWRTWIPASVCNTTIHWITHTTTCIYSCVHIDVKSMHVIFLFIYTSPYRDVCLIAVDSLYTTTACITLYYIGSNSNPPTITYNPEGVAHFTEGQSDPVRIVEGSIVVEDDDHPTR